MQILAKFRNILIRVLFGPECSIIWSFTVAEIKVVIEWGLWEFPLTFSLRSSFEMITDTATWKPDTTIVIRCNVLAVLSILWSIFQESKEAIVAFEIRLQNSVSKKKEANEFLISHETQWAHSFLGFYFNTFLTWTANFGASLNLDYKDFIHNIYTSSWNFQKVTVTS